MRLTDHVTLNFNNNMSTAAVFLDIEKAFDATWHPSLIYKLSKLEFSAGIMKLIGSFLSNRKFTVSLKARCIRQEKYKHGCHKVPSCPQPDAPQSPSVHLAPFADDMYIHHRPQGGLCSQKAAARSHFSGVVV
jgi:hypothetical protein